MMRKLILLITAFIFLSCTKTYDALSGKEVYTLLPPEEEIKIGKMYVPLAIEQNDGRYPDKQVQEYVQQIGEKIAKHTPRKLDYKFYVVNTKEINAFALPGGFIFVNRGLILSLDKEDELAGVLAHELAHVNARHHARFLEKVYGLNILLSVAGIFAYQSRYGDILMQFGKIGAQLLSLRWSREHETEADTFGVRFAYDAGYDPRGLLDTFKIFKKLDKIKQPEWLLTHPLPDTRIKNVKKLISKLDLNKPLIEDSPQFHIIKEKLEKTKLSFDLYYKAKEKLSKNKKIAALKLLDKSLKYFPENNASLTMKAFILLTEEEFKEGTELAVKATKLDEMFFRPHFFAGYGYFKLKKYKKSVKYLEKAKNLIPDFPDTYYFLGRDYEALGKNVEAVKNYRKALKLTDGKRGWEKDAKRRLSRLLGI
ncbi:Putative Zn-dependent protease, contains TPR repeats [Persephonella hydrogeniphila]|uniref:Putative Zn-dependent protease, contains TPR repeats n=1 Tax=Persephonella hydrogeniphila TaxID=198703 RepID=A0A285NLG8_9AQUI|nr:M48 family metalloprotease [Persephonella hydrogeniphila]SNZ08491.1 Putative Zn-dependent protease, contains TPR repeats [Persephonella hydrogeniphila]